ncbi:aldo/keto reductase [Nonomuraea sp. B5E05]|uniref:aldo/keto reductase n=1 Tax=Nonomuraea sp. B5E05 TaxID=3153569 RepID=UPI0032617240
MVVAGRRRPRSRPAGHGHRSSAPLRPIHAYEQLRAGHIRSSQPRRGRPRLPSVAAVQNHFNIAGRDDVALLDTCARAGIAFVPFFPLGGGRTGIDHPAVVKVAGRHHATVHQIALAWLLARSPAILAIPGTGSVAHLETNLAARAITLTEEDLADLA